MIRNCSVWGSPGCKTYENLFIEGGMEVEEGVDIAKGTGVADTVAEVVGFDVDDEEVDFVNSSVKICIFLFISKFIPAIVRLGIYTDGSRIIGNNSTKG